MIADTVFMPLNYSHNLLLLCHLATFCTELCCKKGGQVGDYDHNIATPSMTFSMASYTCSFVYYGHNAQNCTYV